MSISGSSSIKIQQELIVGVRTRSMTKAGQSSAGKAAKRALESEGPAEIDLKKSRRSRRLAGSTAESVEPAAGAVGSSGGGDNNIPIDPDMDLLATKVQAAYRGHSTRAKLIGKGFSEEIKEVVKEDKLLFQCIYQMQEHLQTSKNRGLVLPADYYRGMKQLQEAKDEFAKVDKEVNAYIDQGAKKTVTAFKEKYLERLGDVRLDLINFAKKYGGTNIDQLRFITKNEGLSQDNLSSLGDLVTAFQPTGYYTISMRESRSGDNQLRFFNPSERGMETINLRGEMHQAKLDALEPFFIDSSRGGGVAPYQSMHGANLVIPMGDDKGVMVRGVFPNDAISVLHSHGALAEKKESFTAAAREKFPEIPAKFKRAFLEQLGTKDLMLMTDKSFLFELKTRFNEVERLGEEDFAELPKQFLSSNPDAMARTLSNLLMNDDKGLCLLLYPILSTTAPPIAQSVFNSMHFSLQEKLRTAEVEFASMYEKLQSEIADGVTLEARILASPMDERTKASALGRLKSADDDGSEGAKAKKWVEGLLQLPIGRYAETKVSLEANTPQEISSYMGEIESTINDSVHGHDEAKKQLMRVMGQWVANGGSGGEVIAIQGPPGNGKTTFAKEGIAKALGRPFCFIPLGGAQDSSLLVGHEFTYVGSKWGKISEQLMQAKVMNPVIYIDELDKISSTERGREITGVLTHLMDSAQNKEFEDVYFDGIKLDLSRALFVCSYNDEGAIDPILKDRMITIRTKGHSNTDKVAIAQKYLIPKMLKEMSMEPGSIVFSDEMIRYLIESYTHEAGVRRLKETLTSIVREINLERLVSADMSFPIEVDKELVHKCLKKPRDFREKVPEKPTVGTMNGLYADAAGGGGITVVQVVPTISDKRTDLVLTGSQGKVMIESVRVAHSVAWQLLPDDLRHKLLKEEPFGLHLHFTDTAQAKDGPSAGGAITSAIVSQLTGVPLRNDVATTGEIDTHGKITAIGGLDCKLIGAKKAGVKKVLFPAENLRDFEELKEKNPELMDDTFTAEPISHISELLKHVLVPNELKFNEKVERLPMEAMV